VRIADAAARQQGHTVRLTLTLVQSTPAYELRLPVAIQSARGSVTREIEIRQPREAVTIDVATMPQDVRLDPDLRVWRLLERDELPPILRQWIVAHSPRLVIASGDSDVRAAAQALAARLCESAAPVASLDALTRGSEPVLLAGLAADVDAALAQAGLPPRPANVAGRGTAQVWTLARAGSPPVAVVSARDAGSLRALLAPLPHYGSQSWLVFDGRRALDRGIWPAPVRPVAVRDLR
jgi:aminopeptidase N